MSLQAPRLEIKNRFKQFLRTFVDDQGKSVYREKIKQMCEGKNYINSRNPVRLSTSTTNDLFNPLSTELV